MNITQAVIGSRSFSAALLISVILLALSFTVDAAKITYEESQSDISNPDRGFYYPYTTSSSAFSALDKAELISRRTVPYTPFQGNYQVKSSIALRHYVLDSFINTDTLSPTFVNAITADFDIARQAGVRLMLRFSYTETSA